MLFTTSVASGCDSLQRLVNVDSGTALSSDQVRGVVDAYFIVSQTGPDVGTLEFVLDSKVLRSIPYVGGCPDNVDFIEHLSIRFDSRLLT